MRDLHRISEEGKGKEGHIGLARLVEEHVDLDALLAIAAGAAVPPAPAQPAPELPLPRPRVRVAVAKDVAFGHSYSE
jgi:cobyrinic acid a,c-diamide synthase